MLIVATLCGSRSVWNCESGTSPRNIGIRLSWDDRAVYVPSLLTFLSISTSHCSHSSWVLYFSSPNFSYRFAAVHFHYTVYIPTNDSRDWNKPSAIFWRLKYVCFCILLEWQLWKVAGWKSESYLQDHRCSLLFRKFSVWEIYFIILELVHMLMHFYYTK